MCKLRANVTNLLQYIKVNTDSDLEVTHSPNLEVKHSLTSEEYFSNLYSLFTYNVNKLLTLKEPTSLKIVTPIWPTLYHNFIIYLNGKSKRKDTPYEIKRRTCEFKTTPNKPEAITKSLSNDFIKDLITLCTLPPISKLIISTVAKTLWEDKLTLTLDSQINLCLTNLFVYTRMHKFLRCTTNPDFEDFIEGKNIMVERAIRFLAKTTPEEQLRLAKSDLHQLKTIIRIFNVALNIFDNVYTEENRVRSDNDD
jgi:hypothetical protein